MSFNMNGITNFTSSIFKSRSRVIFLLSVPIIVLAIFLIWE